ncbi:hypothetical protein BGW36DRAFT_431855 [Talaromyces proteolyticus]|uniref:Uncharacterized protein n=1 Tax=Talaromyces proteolyticus TaxID=1131652 RepID=A0AAD4KFR8_9EURO|nr:uncharacterized protein BGW36DRAFT_431855 [Talaromyces proteolyticus]KAH8691303.1 hypothetical protein BGW36DRAFT_431855 [Talaromyces proteolyticus]
MDQNMPLGVPRERRIYFVKGIREFSEPCHLRSEQRQKKAEIATDENERLKSRKFQEVFDGEEHIILHGPCYVPSIISDPEAPKIHLTNGQELGYFSVIEDDFIKGLIGPIEERLRMDRDDLYVACNSHSQTARLSIPYTEAQPEKAQNLDKFQEVEQEQRDRVQSLLFQRPNQKHASSAFHVDKKRNQSIQNWLSSLNISPDMTDTQFDPPDPLEVLHNMLEMTKSAEIYKAFYALKHGLLEIGGDTGEIGIYLRILWKRDNPDHFYLYVGQSIQLIQRLNDHRDPKYRRLNPSLHYFIWDLGLIDPECQMDEKFVFLSIVEGDVDRLLLNLLEMWCCLILQTFTKNALLAYLPQGTVGPRGGMHLNVALPIYQSTRGDAVVDTLHGDLHHSNDPFVQQYYSSLRKGFFGLKNSPNPAMQEYYRTTMRNGQVKKSITLPTKVVEKALQGMEVVIRTRANCYEQNFTISHFTFNISPKWVILNNDDIVIVRCDLHDGVHPHRYATTCQDADPAARLGVHVEGTDTSGKAFEGWLQSDGKMVVLRMNTFVDLLEGVDLETSMKLPRRWAPHPKPGQARGNNKPFYTSDNLDEMGDVGIDEMKK